MRILLPLTFLALLALAACGPVASDVTPIPSPSATPSPSPSPSPSATRLPPSPTPEPLLLEGRVLAPLNVRREPAPAAEVIGTLASGENVQVDLQSQDGQWYRIRYPAAPQGMGWVSARYLELSLPTSLPSGIVFGQVTQRLNVRRGPGTNFESLGVLEARSLVLLTGKNRSASWLRVQYPFGTEKYGWIAAQYVKAEGVERLPLLNEDGLPIAVATSEGRTQEIILTPTPAPAPDDGDSATSPAVRFRFDAQSNRRLLYSSQLSFPVGDPEDWIEFIPFDVQSGALALVQIALNCQGGEVVLELWQGGLQQTGVEMPTCGSSPRRFFLAAGQAYQVRIRPQPAEAPQRLTYWLQVDNLP